MKKGASDYVAKPFSPEELLLRIDKALAWTDLAAENRILRERVINGDKYKVIVGQSHALLEILELVAKVAPTDARILLLGESGTGKELIARCIHRHSSRQNAPFFAINCGAFNENLLESELFGHDRGAFTGAVASKKGIFDAAYGGTLFLDEISETSTGFQTKLLRVLQEGEFLRVGGTRQLKTNVRIISASNKDPRTCIDQGTLRKDLFYRIGVVQIQMPRLRDRAEDIQPLANHFVDQFSRQIKKKIEGIHPDALDILTRYSWPGNIRELQNVIERAIIMAKNGNVIQPQDLPADLMERKTERRKSMREIRNMERELLLRTLQECNWNRSLAAKKLGIGRRTLYDWITRLRISLRPAE